MWFHVAVAEFNGVANCDGEFFWSNALRIDGERVHRALNGSVCLNRFFSDRELTFFAATSANQKECCTERCEFEFCSVHSNRIISTRLSVVKKDATLGPIM